MRGPRPPWRASWPLSPHAHCSRRRGQRRAAPLAACGSGTRWARVQDGPSGQGRAPSRRRLWSPGPAGSGEATSSTWTPRRQRKVYFPVNGKGTQALGPEGWNLLINTWQKSEFRDVKRSRCPNGKRRRRGGGTASWRLLWSSPGGGPRDGGLARSPGAGMSCPPPVVTEPTRNPGGGGAEGGGWGGTPGRSLFPPACRLASPSHSSF